MNSKKISVVTFFILSISIRLIAQQPLNLDFEVKSVEGINRPWGWDIKSWGPTIFNMDSLTVKNGKFSMHSKCQDNQHLCTPQSMIFGIESFELKNQKISLTGNIKTLNLKGNASLSLGYTYFNGESDSFLEIDTTSTPISGSTEWKEFLVDMEVPDSAQMVYITINHAGTGEAWFDDFELSISGKPVDKVMVAPPLSKQEMTWLVNNSRPINYVFPTDSIADTNENSDLVAFKNLVSNSRLIALGEATHGTREFFTLKNRLFQFAVKDLGVRVFAIEDNQLVVEKVNIYIHGGKGTAIESMSGMFDVWYTESVPALIEWVKSYNKTHIEDQLSFVGFDMQEINRPIDSLFAFLKNLDTVLFEKSKTTLKSLKDNGSRSYEVNDSTKLSWLNSANEILEEIKSKSSQWLSSSTNDKEHIIMGMQYAKLVKQFAENIYKGHWSLYRDEAMAENITWLLESRFPKSKIVIWAHDVHISRGDHSNPAFNLNSSISMGSFLSKKYGNEYKSFSLSTYQGAYLALTSYIDFTKVHCTLFKSPIGSLDEALHQVSILKNSPNLFLELPRTKDWLYAPLPKRFANHVSIDYGYWERVSIPDQFDGIFFIDKTIPSTFIIK